MKVNHIFTLALPYISFGLLLAGLWITFRHQIGAPINAKSSISFWGEGGNPYALKEAYFNRYLLYPGILITICGGVLSIVSSYVGVKFPSGKEWVVVIFIVSIIFVLGVCVQRTARAFAKKSYYPALIEHQRKVYESSSYILRNDGAFKDDPPGIQLKEKTITARIESATKSIFNTCDILEIKRSSDVVVTLSELDKIFQKQ